MKVTPTRTISGLIDGVQWLAPGEVMDISDDSAVALIASGDVEAVMDAEPEADAPKRRARKTVETAAAPVADVETAAVED